MLTSDYKLNQTVFQKLVPHECPGLTKIRVGRDEDGGYVLPADILQTSKSFLTFGVNDEDSFEMDVYKRTKSDAIVLCDPFVRYSRENSPLHFYAIGLSGESLGFMRTLPDFLEEYSISRDHLLLKIDIEKGEYPSFAALTAKDLEGVDCLLLEIHGLVEAKMTPSVLKLLDLLNEVFVLYHIHANNNGWFLIENGRLYPDVVEATYLSRAYLDARGIQPRILQQILPDPAVDRVNNNTKQDYPLFWWL